MTWTDLHGALLGRAFANVLREPAAGAIAFARCLTPDVVEGLAADESFAPDAWRVLRVVATDGMAERTISADQAVELREGKGDALLLLVDTERAGAGMDGIYSAGREVDEASLFREARRLARREITRRRSSAMRRYADASLKEAARGHRGGVVVSPWTEFDFLCRVAAGERSPGAYLHLLGLWPIRDDEESDDTDALNAARRFTERLLGPAAASLPPPARIEALRLDDESRQRQARLQQFLHAVDAKPVRSALQKLTQYEDLWVGALRIEPPPRSLKRIELTSWRNRNGTMSSWSGLKETDGADEPPALILSKDADRPEATLEIRWKADPDNLPRNAVDYRVVVQSGTLDEELAARDVPHSARKGGEKCRFSGGDFATLDDDSVLSARVVVSVLGNDTVERQESEEFVIRFGNPPERETGGVGVKVRAFSEGLVELPGRDDVSEVVASKPSLTPVAANPSGWITLRTPVANGRRRSFRVFRPSLIAEVEWDWHARQGRIGRWVVRVRGSGERADGLRFEPLGGSGREWDRAADAGRRLAGRFADTGGGVAQVLDEKATRPFDLVKEFLLAWAALLESGDPALALVNTVEVQSLSGGAIGLIVLPAHPLRVAWHAAYDNLVLHAAFDQGARPHDIRRELAGLDGAMFPAVLPNPGGGAYVFADTLGFHAVGMVPDADREPEAAVTMLARALGNADSADAAPTVGGQSAAVLGGEILKYLDCHDTARLMLLHALRAGDGMTVARALGTVHERYRSTSDGAEDTDQPPSDAPVFSLELYPSAEQRGVTGRFIAAAQERRRSSGTDVLARQDRWMLESLSLPGGVNLPRLRWARKETPDPNTAAHLAVAFDTFESRVDAGPARTPRPYHAFGLLSFYEREYAGQPAPRWISASLLATKGEKHPSRRAHSETLARLQLALEASVAGHLGAPSQPAPALTTEVSADKADSLQRLHRLCDWVVTLDRNAGVEYFDSPLDNRAIYDAYVIDCVPEREDLGCLQLITSTANLEEVRGLLDNALDRMGLSRSRRNAEFLLERLKALSGRLAIRLTGHRPATSELIALALAHANCRLAAPTDDCWVSLADGFIVPVDDVRDLLPPLSTEGTRDRAAESRPDLIHVTAGARKGLAFRFIEVKHRRHLRAARAPEVLEAIRRQTQDLRERWLKWYAHDDVCSAFRAVRRAKLARVLRFYADKAHRHGLPTARHMALIAEIDRMVERGGEYTFASGPEDRGWVFCPEFTGDHPLPISPDDWDMRIFLFGPGRLPDSDFRTAPAPPAAAEWEPDEPMPPSERDAAASDASEATPSDPPSPVPDAPTPATAERAVPEMLLGNDVRTNASVRWPLTVQGNPHLLLAGLPGMGKTTCLLQLCRQMVDADVRPIVFSYHQDIDEKLAQQVPAVRFVDCDAGLGFHPLQVIDRSARRAHLDVAAEMRDIFTAIFPELGDVQGERVRTAVKESFAEAGWGADAPEPPFVRFVELLRADPKPDRGLRTLLARLNELDDYGFFDLQESHRSLWEHEQPTVIRVHTTQNENLQRAFAALVFYGLYKDMFRRGLRDRITHAVIFDEAHRAARLRLIPTMAKECRKYGISLVLASQEARDFDSSVFSAIANYLVLRLTEADARFLVRNVATSQQERALIDRIKQMERFKGLFFAEGKSRPHALNLAFETSQSERNQEQPQVSIDPEILSGTPCIAGTRIPAHDIADMVANGDTVAAILDAYPSLTEELIRAACAYAQAHPRANASHELPWRKAQPYASEEKPFDDLTPES